MHKYIKQIILISLSICFVFPKQSFAQQNGEYSYDLGPKIVLKENINIQNEIYSDTYLAGFRVIINAPIRGDLYVVSQYVEINSEISGDVRLIVQEAEINSHISGSLSGLISDLNITSLGEIDKDVYGFIENIDHKGRIGGNLNISPQEDANATIQGKIMGAIYYTGKAPSIISEQILPKMYFIPNPYKSESEGGDYATLIVLRGLSLIVLIFLIYKFLPSLFEFFANAVNLSFRKTILRGLISISLIMVLSIILFLTFVGIPSALILGTFLIISSYISPILGAIYISNKIFSERYNSLFKISISLFLLLIIYQAPIIGAFISILTILWTIGILTNGISLKSKSE